MRGGLLETTKTGGMTVHQNDSLDNIDEKDKNISEVAIYSVMNINEVVNEVVHEVAAKAAEQKHKAAKNEAAERCKKSMRAFRHIAANSSSPGEVFAAEVAAELLSTKTNRESSNDLD